jgi:hypothetical protein
MQRASITFNGNYDYITISGRTTANGGANGWQINFKGRQADLESKLPMGLMRIFITVEYMDIEGPGSVTYSSDGRGLDLTPFSGPTTDCSAIWKSTIGNLASTWSE